MTLTVPTAAADRSPAGDALSVSGLNVSLAGRSVLHNVCFTVPPGCLIGLIGPNGAGKTTLMRALLGLVPISSGSVQAGGTHLSAPMIGYVPQRHEFAWEYPISVRQCVDMAARLHPDEGSRTLRMMRRFDSIARRERHERVSRALDRVELSDLASRPIGQLSGGQRQRVLVARALAGNPQLLFLDEPFTGLDMPTQELLTDLFQRLTGEGCTIMMSTHDIASALHTCDQLLLLNRTVIAHGTAAELADPTLWVQAFHIRSDNPLLRLLPAERLEDAC